jgi:tetratricopeptide (TPR) repeat protein
MKYVQIHTFYDQYLRNFYDARPTLKEQPYQHQLRAILDDGFTATHLWGEHLEALGFESHLLITNCPELQSQWALENGITQLDTQDWQKEIVKRQIEILKPDILYVCNPIDYDAKFMRTLNFTPRVIAGWRGQTIFDWNDFSCFDAILSSDPISRSRALEVGAKSVYHFLPGFPEWIAEKVKNEPKLYDVGFCGQITQDHKKRSEIVDAVSQNALMTKRFTPTFFVHQSNPYPFQHAAPFLHASRWGIEMHREIKRTKIGLNIVIDFAKGEAGNMRQFEIAGTGTFLLTEFHSQLSSQFSIGTEIETYKTNEELFEKIAYFTAHDSEREEIARRGQARCFKDHGMSKRVIEFAAILKELLDKKSTQYKNSKTSIYGPHIDKVSYFLDLNLIGEAKFVLEELLKIDPKNSEGLALKDKIERVTNNLSDDEANRIIDQAVAHLQEQQYDVCLEKLTVVLQTYPHLPHVHYIAGMALSQINKLEEAKYHLLQELRINPENLEVKDLLDQLDQEILQSGNNQQYAVKVPDTLVFGVHDESVISQALNGILDKRSNAKLIIVFNPDISDGAPLSNFEKNLNQLISEKNAWSQVVLLRGSLPHVCSEYRHLFSSVGQVIAANAEQEQEVLRQLK